LWCLKTKERYQYHAFGIGRTNEWLFSLLLHLSIMSVELYRQCENLLEWIEDNREEWSDSQHSLLVEDLHSSLEVVVNRLEKEIIED